MSARLAAGLALAALPAVAATSQPPPAADPPNAAAEARISIPPINADSHEAVRALLEANQPPEARNNAAPGPDAFLLLSALITRIDETLNALDKPQRDKYLLAISDATNFDRPQAILPAAREGLAMLEAAGAFEALDRIAATPRAMGEPSSLISPSADHFTLNSGSRNLARAAAARFISALEDGDQTTAAASYEHILAIARAHTHRLTAINRMTGDALIAIANDRLRTAILRGDLHANALDGITQAIDRQLAHRPPIAATIEMERLYLIGALDTLTPGADPQSLAPFRTAAVDTLTDRFRAHQTLANAEPPARSTNPQAIAAAESLRHVKPLPLPYAAAAQATTILPRLIELDDQTRLDIAATRLMIALEQHRLRTGAYPNQLTDLVPAELDQLASPTGDSYGLIYKKRGDLYTLYSPGLDLEDNNAAGKLNDRAALTPEGAGTDMVYR